MKQFILQNLGMGKDEYKDVLITFSCSNIVNSNFARFSFFKSFDMSIDQIGHVNVISYTGAIWSRVICSSYLKR